MSDYPYETGNIADFDDNLTPRGSQVETLDWTDPDLARITRLRLVTDSFCPFWDVSYCYGITKAGVPVRVDPGFHQLRRGPGITVNGQILAAAKRDGVYAKGLGIFDAISCCW